MSWDEHFFIFERFKNSRAPCSHEAFVLKILVSFDSNLPLFQIFVRNYKNSKI